MKLKNKHFYRFKNRTFSLILANVAKMYHLFQLHPFFFQTLFVQQLCLNLSVNVSLIFFSPSAQSPVSLHPGFLFYFVCDTSSHWLNSSQLHSIHKDFVGLYVVISTDLLHSSPFHPRSFVYLQVVQREQVKWTEFYYFKVENGLCHCDVEKIPQGGYCCHCCVYGSQLQSL